MPYRSGRHALRVVDNLTEEQRLMVRRSGKGRVHVRVALPNGGSIDEADIALIETIRTCGSILGASRLTGTSYRKTWLMVDALNRTFDTKVIETYPGRRAAGAEVTQFGERLVALFRSIERRSATAAGAAIDELSASLDSTFAQHVPGEGSALRRA
jgi:molybdate transport system regulatory protein